MTISTLLQAHDLENPGIAVLTFNRPEAHNALTTETMIAFAEAVDSLAAQDGLCAVILTGAGEKAFCSGADIAEMAALTSEADAIDMITRMGEALIKLERLPVPVIAAINGHALGGGAEIAMACDLRIIDAGARLGFVQIRRGLIPGWGGGQRLLRQVGYGRAIDILLRGQVLNADELVALGLATEIATHGQALISAVLRAREIAAQDAEAVRAMKVLLQAGLNHPYHDALMMERALFPPLWAGETRLSSMRSFLKEKGTRE
ncbi:MAG: enoyl-CoA hydratase/isomerase family protein [Chloroflexi bacterium]|nr:enoyl-CoA hydratase/isomerase family protein [Chloroflexota bacterium]